MEPLPLIRFFSFLTACISWLIFHCLLFGEPQDTRGSGSIWDASGLVPAPLVPVTLRLDQRTAPGFTFPRCAHCPSVSLFSLGVRGVILSIIFLRNSSRKVVSLGRGPQDILGTVVISRAVKRL